MRKPLIIVLPLSLLIVCGQAVAQTRPTATDRSAIAAEEKKFYAYMESYVKQEYETLVADANAKLKKPLSAQEREYASDGFKMIFYNKANVYTACWGEIKTSAAPTATHGEIMARLHPCIDAKLGEFITMTKLLNYVKVLPFGTGARCEMEARLFERELLLPPYDFLKTKDGPGLLDAHVYNQCIRSAKHDGAVTGPQ